MEVKDQDLNLSLDRGSDKGLSTTWSRSKSYAYSLPGGMSSIDKANAKIVQ
jgi:hypothetical protein